MSVSERRAARSREILAATRELFDERGLRDAQIEDIARAVGINRAIIYRHFSGKEELFALTLVSYLTEVGQRMHKAQEGLTDPIDRLRAIARSFMDFGEQYPAFVDCALSLLRRPGHELMAEVSPEAMIKLGAAMNLPLQELIGVLTDGTQDGVFKVVDPTVYANVIYTQALGSLTLTRLRLTVRQRSAGEPRVDEMATERVKEIMVGTAVAMAREGC